MEQKIGLLKPGRYFPYLAHPGHYVFYVETPLSFEKIDLDVEPGWSIISDADIRAG